MGAASIQTRSGIPFPGEDKEHMCLHLRSDPSQARTRSTFRLNPGPSEGLSREHGSKGERFTFFEVEGKGSTETWLLDSKIILHMRALTSHGNEDESFTSFWGKKGKEDIMQSTKAACIKERCFIGLDNLLPPIVYCCPAGQDVQDANRAPSKPVKRGRHAHAGGAAAGATGRRGGGDRGGGAPRRAGSRQRKKKSGKEDFDEEEGSE
eukprot:1160116-Pelagomonas_calceolata.AAC.6